MSKRTLQVVVDCEDELCGRSELVDGVWRYRGCHLTPDSVEDCDAENLPVWCEAYQVDLCWREDPDAAGYQAPIRCPACLAAELGHDTRAQMPTLPDRSCRTCRYRDRDMVEDPCVDCCSEDSSQGMRWEGAHRKYPRWKSVK